MEEKKRLSIPGTKPYATNSQLLISTGIPALDQLLGGGVPVGTVLLVDEDTHGSYARVLIRYFVAEGVVNKHCVLLASLDCDPRVDIVSELPEATDVDVEPNAPNPHAADKMKIAFRYQNLPTTDKTIQSKFGHYYDLSRPMRPDQIAAAPIEYYPDDGQKEPNERPLFDNPHYDELMRKIVDLVTNEQFTVDGRLDIKNVLRVCVHHLGSPMWSLGDDLDDLRKFVYCVRCAMRKCFGVAMITIPAHISEKLQATYDKRLVHISDIALRLQSFGGTKLERIDGLKDYHGYFHVVKLAAINSLASPHPGSTEYVYKLRRKKFVIEMLHLPPCLGDVSEDERKEPPSLGCGSSTKHLVDF